MDFSEPRLSQDDGKREVEFKGTVWQFWKAPCAPFAACPTKYSAERQPWRFWRFRRLWRFWSWRLPALNSIPLFCHPDFRNAPNPKGPKIEKIQDLEIFKRDWKFQARRPPDPIFVGNSEDRDWKFQSRLKISSGIENFNRDWFFSIFGPLGNCTLLRQGFRLGWPATDRKTPPRTKNGREMTSETISRGGGGGGGSQNGWPNGQIHMQKITRFKLSGDFIFRPFWNPPPPKKMAAGHFSAGFPFCSRPAKSQEKASPELYLCLSAREILTNERGEDDSSFLARGDHPVLKKRSEDGGANENLSCGFPSIPGIAPGVAPRIVVFVLLLKSWDAIPRMGISYPENGISGVNKRAPPFSWAPDWCPTKPNWHVFRRRFVSVVSITAPQSYLNIFSRFLSICALVHKPSGETTTPHPNPCWWSFWSNQFIIVCAPCLKSCKLMM